MKNRILIADDNADLTAELEKELAQDGDNQVVGVAHDGKSAIELFNALSPDVVVLDLVMPETDGFGFLQNIKKGKAKIIVLSALSRDEFVTKAINLGADYYMRKPCSFRELRQRVAELKNGTAIPARPKKTEMDEKISNIFITVGIPAHIKGYQFLREAIKMAVENPDIINSITSPSKVERAIRHAIEVAWNRGKIENINTLFGVKVYGHNEKPTNGEFIALVADKMILESV